MAGDKGGLSEQVGRAFAQCCRGGERGEDLTLLGGSMFGAFFEEIANIFDELDVVWMRPATDAGAIAFGVAALAF